MQNSDVIEFFKNFEFMDTKMINLLLNISMGALSIILAAVLEKQVYKR